MQPAASAPRKSEAPARLGRHTILGAIGRGGMADVYLAMAHGPSGVRKLVVVKCMRAGNEVDATLSRMFLDEGRLAALLNHPNVVHTYEVAESDDGAYIVMEYLHGQALSALGRAEKPLPAGLAARIAADALAGLHYAHELRDLDGSALSIVHRDLSPPNIFVTYDGVVKLVDFGIAKTAIATRLSTEAGLVKGKLAYMAPEQATSGAVDRRADIYAMGVVLWELLAGRRLVEDLSPASIIRRALHGSAPLVSSVRPEIDPVLDRIVARALTRDPESRYATGLEMREALEERLAEGPPASSKELSQLLNRHFQAQREEREAQIRAWAAAFTPDAAPELELITRRVSLGPLPAEPAPDALESAARVRPHRSRRRLVQGALLGGVLLPGLTAFAFYPSGVKSSGPAPSVGTPTGPVTAASDAVLPSPSAQVSVSSASQAPSADSRARQALEQPRVNRPHVKVAPALASATATASVPPAQPKSPGGPELESNPYLHSR